MIVVLLYVRYFVVICSCGLFFGQSSVLQASALVKVVTAACPIVKTGVGMLGKALQLAERTKMADYLEQVCTVCTVYTGGMVPSLVQLTGSRAH